MKLKQLESALQSVEVFSKPSVKLEQYPTSPHIAAHMLYTIQNSFEEIEGAVIGDFGCGCGMLSIASQILGAGNNVGIEIDPKAVEVALQNVQEYEVDVDIIIADIQSLNLRQSKPFDTIIMNPPFGTKAKGIDMVFLQQALKVLVSDMYNFVSLILLEYSSVSVYSLHKSSTREHILSKAKEWNVEAQVLAELRYDLPAVHKFHKKESVDIEVDFWRFVPLQEP